MLRARGSRRTAALACNEDKTFAASRFRFRVYSLEVRGLEFKVGLRVPCKMAANLLEKNLENLMARCVYIGVHAMRY